MESVVAMALQAGVLAATCSEPLSACRWPLRTCLPQVVVTVPQVYIRSRPGNPFPVQSCRPSVQTG